MSPHLRMFDFIVPHWCWSQQRTLVCIPTPWHLLRMPAFDWWTRLNSGSDWLRGVRRRNVSITREMQMRISWELKSHSQVTSHWHVAESHLTHPFEMIYSVAINIFSWKRDQTISPGIIEQRSRFDVKHLSVFTYLTLPHISRFGRHFFLAGKRLV